jgi:chemotaxis protein MotB
MEDQAFERGDDEEDGGGWLMTFADLMSLLMAFFVLLLSFAEMDINKFKAIAGSLSLAFGVQREVKAPETPVGTSIITQEFSAGRPQPTAINEVRQSTMDANKQTLEFTDALANEVDGRDPNDSDGEGRNGERQEDFEQTAADARMLMEALAEEVAKGMIQIETAGARIIIRIREKASFPSGVARFRASFLPVIAKLRASLEHIDGTIVVAGHTDNVPIKTARFRSNWDLSAARAVSVVHELLADTDLAPARFVVEGHGDAHPLAPNDTAENRALNRRVEMTIQQGRDEDVATEEPLAALVIRGSGATADTGSDGLSTAPIDLPANPIEPTILEANEPVENPL